MYKGTYTHTITAENIKHPRKMPFAQEILGVMGRLLVSDIGKQVWRVCGNLYVENDHQRNKQIKADYE